MQILLPLSALVAKHACNLDRRVAAFEEHHGFAPDETSTLRQWTEVTPSMLDLLWATRCLPENLVRPFSVRTALRAARRVLPLFEAKYPEDKRPREALALVEKWLSEPKSVSVEELRTAAADADSTAAACADVTDDTGAAHSAAYTAARAAAYAARTAAYIAAADSAFADVYTTITVSATPAARAVARAAANSAAAYAAAVSADATTAERAQQRADFMDILTELESET